MLIEIAEKLKSRLNKNGFVILSGLLDSDFDVIRNKYYSIGFEIRRIEKEDEWIALVLGF